MARPLARTRRPELRTYDWAHRTLEDEVRSPKGHRTGLRLETGAIALAIAACLTCLPSHAHTAQHI
jgi:hypothetical protein